MSAKAGLGIVMLAACAWAAAQAGTSEPAAGSAPVEDIRDIRAPTSILARAPLLPIVLGSILLLAAGYGAWRWRRRRGRDPALLPFEFALQQLDRARDMMQAADGRAFGGVVSDIVRHYLERQFNVTVTQRTTEEFMQDLMNSIGTPLAQQRPLLAEFLQQSDVIKFAGGSAALPDREALLRSARRLVHETARAGRDRDPIPAA